MDYLAMYTTTRVRRRSEMYLEANGHPGSRIGTYVYRYDADLCAFECHFAPLGEVILYVTVSISLMTRAGIAPFSMPS